MLTAVPLSRAETDAFIARVHRHHKPPVGDLFRIGAAQDGEIVGVVVVGRPVARALQDGWTCEVTRLATDGTRNACSFLYGAAARAAFAMGYRKIGTYILASEPGTSLKGAGWRLVGEVKGRSWDTPSRPRVDKHPTQDKLRFEATAESPRRHSAP